jgi:5'-nucleotidase
MTKPLPRILITNDDGILSPGLAAVAAAVDDLGELLLVAPMVQQTSMSRARSQTGMDNGVFSHQNVVFGNQKWKGIGINCTPALCVEYAISEISSGPIDLVISGINYGENIGNCVTVSGTIGAALEAADHGIPAIAISLEINSGDYHSFDQPMDFTAAMYFCRQFAKKVLFNEIPSDVDILKIEIPVNATQYTKWVVTEQDRITYYQPQFKSRRDPFIESGIIQHYSQKGKYLSEKSDAYALAQGWVSVTPLSLNLTSRTDLKKLAKILK